MGPDQADMEGPVQTVTARDIACVESRERIIWYVGTKAVRGADSCPPLGWHSNRRSAAIVTRTVSRRRLGAHDDGPSSQFPSVPNLAPTK